MKIYQVTVSYVLGNGMFNQQTQCFTDKEFAKKVFDEKTDNTIETVANYLRNVKTTVNDDDFHYKEGGLRYGILAQWWYREDGRFARVSLSEHQLIETSTEGDNGEPIEIFPEDEACGLGGGNYILGD